MDLILLSGVAIALLVVIITILFLRRKSEPQPEAQVQRVPQRLEGGVPLRAQIARNQRNRSRNVVAEQQNRNINDRDHIDINDDDDDAVITGPDGEKIGAKKRAKLEAKAEKKAHREVEQQLREEKKLREAEADKERKRLEEVQNEEERKQEEAERLARELKEKQEYEEYLKMKEAFDVEEEGFEDTADTESDNLLQEFINYIKENKVVVLEDLAREFKLKTQGVIDRIQDLRNTGALSGVIDDRGKFIYISEEELAAVAKFIRQSGRISITDLAENSNNLINLSPILIK